jgi:hypothetical protein
VTTSEKNGEFIQPGHMAPPTLGQFLVVPTSDQDLRDEYQAREHLIERHIHDHRYYHTQLVHANEDTVIQELAKLSFDDPDAMTAGRLAPLVLNPATRLSAIQHVISRAIFQSLQVPGRGPVSLLPPAVANFLREVPPVERIHGSPDGKSTPLCDTGGSPLTSKPAFASGLTLWRQLSAFLLNPARSDRTPLVPPPGTLDDAARSLVEYISGFTALFVHANLRQQQETHLRGVIVDCAKFGYVLFSHPGEFQFNWKAEPGHIAAHPGLEVVADERAVRLPAPRIIQDPITVRV